MVEGKALKQGILLTGIAILISVISFGKEAFFASCYGVSKEVDAYVIAIQIPEIIFAFVWEAINAVIIPLYSEQLQNRGKKYADRFASNFLFITLSGIVILLVICELFAGQLIHLFSPGIQQDVHSAAVDIIRIVLPMILFEGVIRITEGVLNVQGSFGVPRASRGIRNIVNILFMVILTSTLGIKAAAYGIVTGFVIECCFLVLYSQKYIKYKFLYDLKAKEMQEAVRMMLPVIIAVGVNEINQIADKIVASYLINGSISALNYATKLTGIIRTLILANIITLMYPRFSKYVAEKNITKVISSYISTINITLLLGVPLIIGGIYLREDLISLAFKRGAFDENAVLLVSSVFACYLVGILFVSIDGITSKLFASFHDTTTPMKNASIGVIVNIIANILLSKYWGAIGLATATTLAAVIVAVRGVVITKSKLFYFSYKNIITTFVKSLCSSVLMIICIYILSKFLSLYTMPLLVEFVIKTSIGAMMYILCLFIMQVEELKGISIKKIRR